MVQPRRSNGSSLPSFLETRPKPNHDALVTPDLAVDCVACLSEFHFHRLFRATFGQTPHDFLTRLRMDRARQLLASERTVTEVCFEVGYESLGSFSSKFRAQFGRSPAGFQHEVRHIFGYSAPWRVLMVPGCFLGAE